MRASYVLYKVDTSVLRAADSALDLAAFRMSLLSLVKGRKTTASRPLPSFPPCKNNCFSDLNIHCFFTKIPHTLNDNRLVRTR